MNRRTTRITLLCGMTCLFGIAGCAALKPLKEIPVKDDFKLASLKSPDKGPLKHGDLNDEETADACIAIAENLEQGNQIPGAIAQYERARKAVADRINYARRLAVLYARVDMESDARREFAAAMKISPDDLDLRSDYAFFRMTRGEIAEAESLFREVLKNEPRHESASINLGLCLAKQRRLDEAYEVMRLVVGDAAAHHNLGVVLSDMGDHAQAKQAFQKSVAMNPQSPSQMFLVAYNQQPRR